MEEENEALKVLFLKELVDAGGAKDIKIMNSLQDFFLKGSAHCLRNSH